MKIGIFGGSFDPVHSEHIQLVCAALDSLGLDMLYVMPAHTPPHKRGKVLLDDERRLQMCRIAFSDMPNVTVSDYEIARGGTSYTYLTCRYFRKMYPDAEIFWLVGTDMLRDFPTWKNPQSILDDVTLAVCARNEKDGWLQPERRAFRQKFGKDFAVIHYNGAAVSSTKIRILAGAGMRLTPYVTADVEAYIRQNGLYGIPNADKALALEKPSRVQHSLRVAETAALRASALGVPEYKAVTAALFHDCAKNLDLDSPLLQGFQLSETWGKIPEPVLHQFTGAYVAKRIFGVEDEEILDAVRYHTSGRADMTALGKLIFLADMVEEERQYDGVDVLRGLFWKKDCSVAPEEGLDECLEEALKQTIQYLETKGAEVYPLTKEAYESIKRRKYGKQNGGNE